MANRVRLAPLDQLAERDSQTFSIAGFEISVVRTENGWLAFDDRCPHQGARLSRGELTTEHAVCPLHGWKFDLTTGGTDRDPHIKLKRFETIESEGSLLVELPDENSAAPESVYRYLVRFGAMGWTERLGSIDPIEAAYGQQMIVHTSRGLEVGELLATADPDSDRLSGALTGEVMRSMSAEDESTWKRTRTADIPELRNIQTLIDDIGLSLQIIDGELLFDEQTVVLYFLGDPPDEANEFLTRVAGQSPRSVQLESIEGVPLRIQSGCGSGRCGSGGCGSSDSGCSTDSETAAPENSTP